MRKLFNLSIIFLFFIFFSSCKEQSGHKSDPTGKYYDIIAVAPDRIWNGIIGDTLRAILREEVQMLNRPESMFDLYNTTPQEFRRNTLLQRHRNLITFSISPQNSEPKMSAEYDVYAYPQLIVDISGPDEKTVVNYMDNHRKELQRVFEIAERDRIVNWSGKHTEILLNNAIEDKFGFEMKIPCGYKMRNNSIDDFMWISHEMPIASQGIIIYTYPADEYTTVNMPYLVYKRNEFVKNIPGPTDGSYMTTSPVIHPILNTFSISDRIWYEMRGFWDLENDYMGGPFVSYSTVDLKNKRVVNIDFYVYSPKNDQRNLIRQLENLIFTVEI